MALAPLRRPVGPFSPECKVLIRLSCVCNLRAALLTGRQMILTGVIQVKPARKRRGTYL
jgi:hypothetical protein